MDNKTQYCKNNNSLQFIHGFNVITIKILVCVHVCVNCKLRLLQQDA